MEVYYGHYISNCCSNVGVDTMCYTDLVHLRINKNALGEHHRKIHALIWYQILSLSSWLWFGLQKHFVLQNAHQLVADYVSLLWVYWSLLTENSCLS